MINSPSGNLDIAPYLYGRLISGQWVLITGDILAVSLLEERIYPPGTPSNAGLEAIYGADRFIYLGRKIESLRLALNLANGHIWADLFSIRCRLSMHEYNRLDIQERHFTRGADKGVLIRSLVCE